MSENIINKLSETLTGSIIGIAAIISTVIVGVTIIYIQRKLVRRINKFIEEQHKMVEDENRLDKEMILDYNKLWKSDLISILARCPPMISY